MDKLNVLCHLAPEVNPTVAKLQQHFGGIFESDLSSFLYL